MKHQTHTDEATTKLCYIEDINKAQKYLIKRQITTEEFDFLYDQSLHTLEGILLGFEITIMQVDTVVREGQ